jgi:hypothetical protein
MNKIITFILLPLLFGGCFEEEAAPGFLNGTTWGTYIWGTVFNGSVPLYDYRETHTLIFDKDSFTYILRREETEGRSSEHKEKPEKNRNERGRYIVKYPEVILSTENYEQRGTLYPNVLAVDADENQRLYFSRLQTP